MDVTDDLGEFFGDLDVQITWEGKNLQAHFENFYEPMETNLGTVVEASLPKATCKTSDIIGLTQDDILVIPVDDVQIRYKVIEVKPDGTGITTLILVEA